MSLGKNEECSFAPKTRNLTAVWSDVKVTLLSQTIHKVTCFPRPENRPRHAQLEETTPCDPTVLPNLRRRRPRSPAPRPMPPPRSSSGTRWKARWATASTAGRRVQQEEPRIPGQGSLQGQLRRVDECGHRRVPRRQRARHPPGLRSRHRHRCTPRAPSSRCSRCPKKPATRSIPRNSSAPWPATTRRPTASWCRCRSTAPPWCSTTTRTPSRRPAWTPTSRPRPGKSWPPPAKAQGRRPGMRLHHLVAVLGPAGNVLGLAQRAPRRTTASAAWTPALP